MFEDDPDWLYQGNAVYEQMSLEDLLCETNEATGLKEEVRDER